MISRVFKRLVLAPVFLALGFAMAVAQTVPNTATFERRKAEQLRRVDQRITRLQQVRSCIQNADNEDAVKACYLQLREENKRMGPRSGQSS